LPVLSAHLDRAALPVVHAPRQGEIAALHRSIAAMIGCDCAVTTGGRPSFLPRSISPVYPFPSGSTMPGGGRRHSERLETRNGDQRVHQGCRSVAPSDEDQALGLVDADSVVVLGETSERDIFARRLARPRPSGTSM